MRACVRACVCAAADGVEWTGGGVEVEAHYPQWRRHHCGLESLEALQDSHTKLMDGKVLPVDSHTRGC